MSGAYSVTMLLFDVGIREHAIGMASIYTTLLPKHIKTVNSLKIYESQSQDAKYSLRIVV
jgi:hypothetical protein